jgi:KaiC/GvpD/RAD55 family RecA-like ATPase
MKKYLRNKVEVGIPGIDDLIGGGLPEKSTMLLRGQAGSGKTIFGLQYLIYGALHNEPGILLSIEESREDLYSECAQFGWDLESLVEESMVSIVEKETEYGMTIHELEKNAKMIGAKRAVVDSLPSLFSSFPKELEPLEYRIAFHLLCQVLMKSCGCTSILISETGWFSDTRFEEYVPKGVIELYSKMMDGVSRKFLLIKKMREVRHSRKEHLYEITPRGFTLFIPRIR